MIQDKIGLTEEVRNLREELERVNGENRALKREVGLLRVNTDMARKQVGRVGFLFNAAMRGVGKEFQQLYEGFAEGLAGESKEG